MPIKKASKGAKYGNITGAREEACELFLNQNYFLVLPIQISGVAQSFLHPFYTMIPYLILFSLGIYNNHRNVLNFLRLVMAILNTIVERFLYKKFEIKLMNTL